MDIVAPQEPITDNSTKPKNLCNVKKKMLELNSRAPNRIFLLLLNVHLRKDNVTA